MYNLFIPDQKTFPPILNDRVSITNVDKQTFGTVFLNKLKKKQVFFSKFRKKQVFSNAWI